MTFKLRKRKPKDVQEQSKNLQGKSIESLTSNFKN